MLNNPVDILHKTKQVLASKIAELHKLKQEIAELKSSNFALSVKIEELEKKLSKGSASKKRVAKNDSTSNSDK